MSCACLFCVSFRFQFLFAGHRSSTLISWVFSVLLFSIFMLAYVLHILLVTFSPVHPHCLRYRIDAAFYCACALSIVSFNYFSLAQEINFSVISFVAAICQSAADAATLKRKLSQLRVSSRRLLRVAVCLFVAHLLCLGLIEI